MQSRVVTSGQTSIGTPSRKPTRDARSAPRRGRSKNAHKDSRALLIAASLGLLISIVVATLWFYVRPEPQAVGGNAGRPPPTAADIEAKKTHSYWKVGQETYHHYITDTGTGEIIDAGNITVKEMLAEGIEVPGYSLPNTAAGGNGTDTGAEALAIRFKALQQHLQ
jgi:hypothetical protein